MCFTQAILLLALFTVALPVIAGDSLIAIDICRLPKDPGPCRTAIPRWYYDTNTNSCKGFTYGGCQGNANNFKTKEECEKRCRKPIDCVCAAIFAPVCGVDGKTYDNACTAGCRNVKIACDGECPCKKPCLCTKEYAPVCGVDVKTYGNVCMANCAKVKIACKGRCPCKPPCKKGIVQCLVDPCANAKCEAFPEAKCISNFCGGCNAEFFINKRKVNCNVRPICIKEGNQCHQFLNKKTSFLPQSGMCCPGLTCCGCHPLPISGVKPQPLRGVCREPAKCPLCKG